MVKSVLNCLVHKKGAGDDQMALFTQTDESFTIASRVTCCTSTHDRLSTLTVAADSPFVVYCQK